ncbi:MULTISPECIES: serine hydrolase domain-containing protein [Streptomyces]|uniref:Beta-lactamase family protein n=1 Tax=Streptomyces sudanensis TaxID=436397 RepID=A0ABY4THU2_9ACTN|nr:MULTISPECIES: serine hydrolase domain-containing protein [Streptomyces]MCP9989011.1 beta-lactamase family protein [Streptomyces sudanensis]URN18322.1 beta-lactamase family protein [Streptomyces sudanensis]
MASSPRPALRGLRLAAVTSGAVLLSLTAGALPAQAAPAAPPAAVAGHQGRELDRQALQASLDAIHQAGMYGTYSAVRDGSSHWRGAAGHADVDTGRPVRPGFRHRVGSITKTFTAVAVLQQVREGRVDLDAPIGRYLPDLVPGERGRLITVRMLLNHTSGLGDHIAAAFPGIGQDPGRALDAGRFRHFEPEELVRFGLAAPSPVPRGTYGYSNTNYVVLGLLLREVTGQEPEEYITRHVIRAAGLRHTYFPRTPYLTGPHSRMYESMYGFIDPARDYSVYDMSWGGTAGSLVSTMEDLNSFYRQLLTGRLLGPAELREMKTTVPAYEAPPGQEPAMRYGLGIYTTRLSDGRWYWGHDGAVFGAGTMALSTEDGRRQVALGINLMKYQHIGEDGYPQPHAIDEAMLRHVEGALADAPSPAATGRAAAPRTLPTAAGPRPFAAPDPLRR